MRSCVTTTLPLRLARCSALRPSPSPQVSLTCCRAPWASSRTTERRSSSAVARSSCWPSDRSALGSDARNRRCSYFARIQRSLSSLTDRTQGGNDLKSLHSDDARSLLITFLDLKKVLSLKIYNRKSPGGVNFLGAVP